VFGRSNEMPCSITDGMDYDDWLESGYREEDEEIEDEELYTAPVKG